MIKKMLATVSPARQKILLVLGILLLATFVRFWKMEYVPHPNDGDEMAYIFAGQSLVKYGVPISWSSFSYSQNLWQKNMATAKAVNRQEVFSLVSPWLDHPFLLPVIFGSFSEVLGWEFPTIPPAVVYRLPMLLVSFATLSLIFLIAQKLFNYWSAIFALCIASFSPSLIFIQRMVVGDSFIAMFLLLALYLFLEKRSLFYIVITAVLAAMAKVTGILIVPVICFGLILEKKYRQAIIFGVASLSLIAGFYLLVGWLAGGSEYLEAMKNQSFRLLGWSNPAFLFSNPGFHLERLLDFSYYLILILGLGIFTLKQDLQRSLLGGAIVMAITLIWATSAEQDMLGWYKIPVFCLLIIAAAGMVYARKYFLVVMLLLVTCLNNVGLVRYPTHPLPSSESLRLGVGVALAALLFFLYRQPKERYIEGLIAVLLLFYAGQSLVVVDQYFEGKCTDRECITPTVTFMQSVKDLLSR